MSGSHGADRRVSLPAQPSSVRSARYAIRDWLTEASRPDLVEDAVLAVSEVVTNALVHAGTAVEMTAHVGAGGVRVEVADGNAHLPRAREVQATAGTGRGLRLLEHTVDRWGAEHRESGKVVWFELGDMGGEGGIVQQERGAAADAVIVELVDVPLLLFAAWFEHAGALLREHLLVRLHEGDDGSALEQHAAAGEVLALIAEQWPTMPDLSPERLMADAVEPQLSAPHLQLVVPAAAVASFAVLDEVIDDALVLADAGALLTPPTQPEMRAMRRWLVREVLRQAGGEPPRARRQEEFLEPPPRAPIAWDPAEVDLAATACVAADDTNRIVAVSESALALLGHARDDLVGRRLLTIIPARFRQAHLAGFALHLVDGRTMLIGSPVTVPVLCADGREQIVELIISAQLLAHGRSVFVGQMEVV